MCAFSAVSGDDALVCQVMRLHVCVGVCLAILSDGVCVRVTKRDIGGKKESE